MLKYESTGKQSSPRVIGHRKTTKVIPARQSRPTKCMLSFSEKRLDSQGCQSDPPTTKTTLTVSSTGMPVLCVRSQEANPTRSRGGGSFPGTRFARYEAAGTVRQTIREAPSHILAFFAAPFAPSSLRFACTPTAADVFCARL